MMIKTLASELGKPKKRIQLSIRSSNLDYDTKEEVSTIDEYKDRVVVSDGMLENEAKRWFSFPYPR